MIPGQRTYETRLLDGATIKEARWEPWLGYDKEHPIVTESALLLEMTDGRTFRFVIKDYGDTLQIEEVQDEIEHNRAAEVELL